jgi:hypothetical protein
VFERGAKARIIVPRNSCYLFELGKASRTDRPVLVGAAGSVTRRGDLLEIAGVSRKPGQSVPMRVRLADARAVKRLTANGTRQEFIAAGDEIAFRVQFAGSAHVRELDMWQLANGRRFVFPNHPAGSSLQLATTFQLSADVLELLRRATPKNFVEMGGKIATWQRSRGQTPSFDNPYSYHNFIGQRPERLWLIVPFLCETRVDAELNGRKLAELTYDRPSNSVFVDITDLVQTGTNQLKLSIAELGAGVFMGPYLGYPDEAMTTAVLPAPVRASPPVVYRGPFCPRPRGATNAAPARS